MEQLVLLGQVEQLALLGRKDLPDRKGLPEPKGRKGHRDLLARVISHLFP
jgi:hypothetical protein